VSTKEEEFARVVTTHRSTLLRYALRRLDENNAIDDAVSETFATAWRRWEAKPPKQEELFWLYGIARFVLSNVQRSQRRRLRLYGRLAWERESESEAPRFAERDIEGLIQEMEMLDDEEQEILRLAYWERLTHREIGLVVGCSENAIEIRLRRTRKLLRDRLNTPQSHGDPRQPGIKEMES